MHVQFHNAGLANLNHKSQGFMHQRGEHLVCKLQKSLYGLKQSPRAWNQKLDAFLKSIEFMKSEADLSVYVAQVGGL